MLSILSCGISPGDLMQDSLELEKNTDIYDDKIYPILEERFNN